MTAETVAIISVVGSVMVSIISQLQNSKCTHIDFCCISCDRDPTIDDVIVKKKNDPAPLTEDEDKTN